MTENSVPNLAIDERLELCVSLLGVGAVIAAAYYTGRTGTWEPLMAVSLGLALVVLFVTAEE
ncbi:hypothetical protein C488_09604 [Natrinema pellirubrum DSM 15624]|uniref:Uncharacterized protein n=1 Tax=Natrinema pellirubrum (strain DSM 15624 / CIP 106293 / JCM 10476 / NCIMB 786 / 157) TaxID=797303 RepID=L0JRA0_NATP1|nr:hypothetical protein [Natrinema pellirubrum]AGB32896.1 hypothetical protein Natpe_3103 [Natrinema pellirubrum DSM 15624]ELY75656.1 hypothetical protein C488_09604 [Natrinema pellirubrum DSM 15624]